MPMYTTAGPAPLRYVGLQRCTANFLVNSGPLPQSRPGQTLTPPPIWLQITCTHLQSISNSFFETQRTFELRTTHIYGVAALRSSSPSRLKPTEFSRTTAQATPSTIHRPGDPYSNPTCQNVFAKTQRYDTPQQGNRFSNRSQLSFEQGY